MGTPIGKNNYSLIWGDTAIQRSDGVVFPSVPTSPYYQAYQAWLNAGNTPTPAVNPNPSAYLWQLQAVLTPTQWANVQTAVAQQANPALTAFAATGNVLIPSNSTTLLALGAAIGLTPAQVEALVAQASTVSIP